jgi:hypothetical protein
MLSQTVICSIFYKIKFHASHMPSKTVSYLLHILQDNISRQSHAQQDNSLSTR